MNLTQNSSSRFSYSKMKLLVFEVCQQIQGTCPECGTIKARPVFATQGGFPVDWRTVWKCDSLVKHSTAQSGQQLRTLPGIEDRLEKPVFGLVPSRPKGCPD